MASFATEVKNELARLVYEKPCCRTAELAALLRMGGTIAFGAQHIFGINFTTENAAVARKVLTLLKKEKPDMRTEIMVSRSKRLRKRNSYMVRVVPSQQAADLLSQIGLMQAGSLNMGTDAVILRRSCCRTAYLRGAFLGGGSVNRPESSYHLELVTGSYSMADLLLNLLRRMEFPAGITDRKDDYVVYMKEGDAVIDFLGMIQADKAVERFEVARNVKEVRNQVNRLVNCETANLQKTVDAAGRQLEDIHFLVRQGKLEGMAEQLQETARMRMEHPDATLAELADLLCVSKSGLNHRMRKLRDIAVHLKNGG